MLIAFLHPLMAHFFFRFNGTFLNRKWVKNHELELTNNSLDTLFFVYKS